MTRRKQKAIQDLTYLMLKDLWKEVKGIELLYLKYNWNRIVACCANIITNSKLLHSYSIFWRSYDKIFLKNVVVLLSKKVSDIKYKGICLISNILM